MEAITDYDIQALVDNELPYERKKEVMDRIKEDPNFNRRYQQLILQKQLLQLWWQEN